jgi:hypothetical protein
MVSSAAWLQDGHVMVTLRSATISTQQSDNFFNRPDVIRDPGFHCRSDAGIV